MEVFLDKTIGVGDINNVKCAKQLVKERLHYQLLDKLHALLF